MFQIDSIMERAEAVVRSHSLGNGQYSRYLLQNASGSRKFGPNEYGTADAANILYTLNRFPAGMDARLHADALKSFQNPDTGLFNEPTHHFIHTTAHCTASLELFGEKPTYPLKNLTPYFEKTENLYALLESLNWSGNPWPQSHQGAGIYVCGVLTDSVSLQWQRDYFNWIYRNTDPDYGFSKIGAIGTGEDAICHHLYGWFHYMFNMDYARKPLRYPEKFVDSCIRMYREQLLLKPFGHSVGFAEVDWVYALNRATRQTSHRFEEAKELILDFAETFIPYLDGLDFRTDTGIDDLHMLFGALCALSELQRALPGEIESSTPMRLVLDRRPFI